MVSRAMIALEESELKGIFNGHESEMTYIWKEGGIWCRCLIDMNSTDRLICLDLKTTGTSANPEDFIRMILSHGYDIQEAWYRRGVKAITGNDPKFIFMVQETKEPYLCSFIGLSPAFQAMAEQKVIRGMDLWRQCMGSGEWPGYGSRIAWVEPPSWSLNWEMRSTFLGNQMEDI